MRFTRKRCKKGPAMAAPEIEFVNHASFIFDCGSVRMICDPWLGGPAFNHGWRLLSPTSLRRDRFESITHLWWSHQHPDHFSPHDVRSIDPAFRARIATLYQQTRDKKVIRFSRALGFKDVTELPDRRWYRLSDDLTIMCGKWDDRDSWLALRSRDTTVLNLNDCFVSTREQADEIVRCVGDVDVLMTQFSYANWAGNPDDPAARRKEAELKLREIRIQRQAIKPEIIIPFASFVWFSHEENFYHNAEMNRVGAIAGWIEQELGCTAVVLYPGDRWRIGSRRDWRPAAARYDGDFTAMLAAGPADRSDPVSADRIIRAMRVFLKRVKQRNPAIGLVPGLRTSAYVTDLNRAFLLSLSGLEEVPPDTDVDLQLTSDSLYFALQTPWGANALAVNGRFSVPPKGNRDRFFRFFRAADLNDHGFAFDYGWAASQLVKRLKRHFSPHNQSAMS
jgi:UDP-MurNAc hydroxylase